MAKRPQDADAGDRVRVTYETTLTYSQPRRPTGMVLLGEFGDALWHVNPDPTPGDRKIVNVEVIADAEPDRVKWLEGYEWALKHLTEPGVLADARRISIDGSL